MTLRLSTAAVLAGVVACRAPGGAGPVGSGSAAPAASDKAPPPLDTSWQTSPGRLLAAGDGAPRFEGIGHTGMRVRLGAFFDQAPVVVYFYGRDASPDAEPLARGFRDIWLNLHARAGMVIGVSPDDRVTHRDFATREELPFLLVADEKGLIARAFGVPQDGAEHRATFVVGKGGKILRVFSEPNAEGHAAEVLSALPAE